MVSDDTLQVKHLGQRSAYVEHYDPALLEAVPRTLGRNKIGLAEGAPLPFSGFDLWTAFELSWLNSKGKPQVGIAEFTIPCETTHLPESKSFKLYLNSFNQTRVASPEELHGMLTRDLTHTCGGKVSVKLFAHMQGYDPTIFTLPGSNIDGLDISIDDYQFNPDHLLAAVQADAPTVIETLNSNLLKSNCLITQQPDWGSVLIHYEGKPIDREKLLRYLISFRQHNEFHEQCVERIFMDLKHYCQPDKLTVFARYTRRGGLDINPLRSDNLQKLPVGRLLRQ
ncbi:MAG: NADPH-dependent 7-cyano-7-deazaguanine reductase QueF [Enterobacteriaceae bacterium]